MSAITSCMLAIACSTTAVIAATPDRTLLGGDIAHYRYDVAVGPGQFDVIRLHRIVRLQAGVPAHTADAVMLLPGLPNFFESIFVEPLISQVPAWDRSVAVFLAKNDIDVWGIDYGWAFVPAATTDFSFMKGWGIQKDSQHVQVAMSIARFVRGLTGHGYGPIHLAGFSFGGILAYSAAGEETQQPSYLRSVKGLIIFDGLMKSGDASVRATYCKNNANYQAKLNSGVYNNDYTSTKTLGDLAVSNPNDPSPLTPGLTNYQAALSMGTSGIFVGGVFDEKGVPTDLRYTEARLWLDLLRASPAHYPVQLNVDMSAARCGAPDVPFDDHLGEIAVPILDVVSARGSGISSVYTTSLTASKDVSKLMVQLLPDSQRKEDFGHADVFMAKDAETLVWKPILDWMKSHR